jgi:hypothetical protein
MRMRQKSRISLWILTAVAPVTMVLFQNCGRFTPIDATQQYSASLGSTIPTNPDGTAAGGITVPGGGVIPVTGGAACADEAIPPVAAVQTITKLEYNNVIRDLFGLNNDFAASFNAARYGLAGFSSESEAQVLSAAMVNDFWTASKMVTDVLFSTNPGAVLTCASGDACAKTIIKNVTDKAFRRPATQAELDKLFAVFKGSSDPTFANAIKLSMRAILMAPQFIFRVYNLPANGAAQAALTDYELASRLSFFIWGSIPDSPLLAAAAAGTLKDPATLETHVRRMLKDPRARYLTKTFGRQWLDLDKFDGLILDAARFPNWNADLKQSMKTETETFIDNVFFNDQSIMEFVTAKYSFVDSRVADVYKVNAAGGSQFVRTNLDQTRFGVLTQPAILAMNSLSNHTSPVRRGKFTLERILCSGPGSPPANIPPLPATAGGDLTDESAIRDRLAAHRMQGSTCAACHSSMDPIGLTYENYNSLGEYRTMYINGKGIDASGRLPTGENLTSFADFARLLATDPRYPACFTAKLLTFAEGTDMTKTANRCTVAMVQATGAKADKKFSDLVAGLVKSKSFRNRSVSY